MWNGEWWWFEQCLLVAATLLCHNAKVAFGLQVRFDFVHLFKKLID
jgi:hypothetical protein